MVRGATLVLEGLPRTDISIEDGRFKAIGPDLPGAQAEIDASGCTCFPAIIDVHLHFNEPGRTEWEGGETGSRALAAGGGTLFFDMPLNSTPCTTSAREFDRKCAALIGCIDHGLWPVGRPGSGKHSRDGGTRARGRGRVQSIHVRFRTAGVSARGRPDSAGRACARRPVSVYLSRFMPKARS